MMAVEDSFTSLECVCMQLCVCEYTMGNNGVYSFALRCAILTLTTFHRF